MCNINDINFYLKKPEKMTILNPDKKKSNKDKSINQ